MRLYTLAVIFDSLNVMSFPEIAENNRKTTSAFRLSKHNDAIHGAGSSVRNHITYTSYDTHILFAYDNVTRFLLCSLSLFPSPLSYSTLFSRPHVTIHTKAGERGLIQVGRVLDLMESV